MNFRPKNIISILVAIIVFCGCKTVKVYKFTDNGKIKRIFFAKHNEVSTKQYLSARVLVYRLPKSFKYNKDTNQLKPFMDSIVKKNKWVRVLPFNQGYYFKMENDSVITMGGRFHRLRDAGERIYFQKNEIVYGIYSYGKF